REDARGWWRRERRIRPGATREVNRARALLQHVPRVSRVDSVLRQVEIRARVIERPQFWNSAGSGTPRETWQAGEVAVEVARIQLQSPLHSHVVRPPEAAFHALRACRMNPEGIERTHPPAHALHREVLIAVRL